MATVALLTAEEYARLPDDGECITELVRGIVVRSPFKSFEYGLTCGNVAEALHAFVREKKSGRIVLKVGIITERDPDTVRGPDVTYFSFARLPREVEVNPYPPVAPDIAVEVRSPSDHWADIHRKVAEYLAAGVVVVCVADYRAQTVSLFYNDKPSLTLTANDTLTLPEALAGFSVPVAEIFE